MEKTNCRRVIAGRLFRCSAAIAEPVIEDKNKRVNDRCNFSPIQLSMVCTEH